MTPPRWRRSPSAPGSPGVPSSGHFPDKRELLVAGQETLSRLLADGISEAPANAGPLEAVAAGLERASSAMGPMNRELGPRLKAAVAASTELQERDALKSVGLAAAMTAALVARGVPGPTAHLAAELGVLAFKQGYAQWSGGDRDDDKGLAHHALAALEDLRAATASLTDHPDQPGTGHDCSREVAQVVDQGVRSAPALARPRTSHPQVSWSRPGYARPVADATSTPLSEHDSLAGPGLALPGAWRRFAERRRSALASSDFSRLVATIRAGPPPGFFRIEWVRRYPNLNEFFVVNYAPLTVGAAVLLFGRLVPPLGPVLVRRSIPDARLDDGLRWSITPHDLTSPDSTSPAGTSPPPAAAPQPDLFGAD